MLTQGWPGLTCLRKLLNHPIKMEVNMDIIIRDSNTEQIVEYEHLKDDCDEHAWTTVKLFASLWMKKIDIFKILIYWN